MGSGILQKLTDGEIASNNGGWQWSRNRERRAVPYFRIMNPWTQAARPDPAGNTSRIAPELRNVPAKKFGEPPAHGERLASNNPAPLVDHTTVRRRALNSMSAAS
jgi:deoxyribodipyrimidine photo-lyase